VVSASRAPRNGATSNPWIAAWQSCGVLKVGLCADIVVFDPEQITDKATLSAPKQPSVGMQWGLINGVPVIADGAHWPIRSFYSVEVRSSQGPAQISLTLAPLERICSSLILGEG
jgi:hypothetical protein